jgi:N utilization substance protein B
MSKKNSSTPSRAAARTAAVQALYMIELIEAKPEKVIEDFQSGAMPEEAGLPANFDQEMFSTIVHRAVAMQTDIDAALTEHLDKGWPLPRLEKILRALLRAATAELLSEKANAAVIINDYVDVAHSFFSGKEPALANAVLDKVAASKKA